MIDFYCRCILSQHISLLPQVNGHCEDTSLKPGDVQICNMQNSKDVYQFVTSKCESELLNSEVFHLDMTITTNKFHRTIRKVSL